jgi:hypothetical protein
MERRGGVLQECRQDDEHGQDRAREEKDNSDHVDPEWQPGGSRSTPPGSDLDSYR